MEHALASFVRDTHNLFYLFLLGTFLIGALHSLNVDHVTAILTMTSRGGSWLEGLVIGAWYSSGHALVVFVIGILGIMVGFQFPDTPLFQWAIGLTFIALASWVAYRWATWKWGSGTMIGQHRHQDEARPSRGLEHLNEHLEHGEEQSLQEHLMSETRMTLLIKGFSWLMERLGLKGLERKNLYDYSPFALGSLHGLGAETPTQLLIIGLALKSGLQAGIMALLVFGLGLIAGDTLLAMLSARAYAVTRNSDLFAQVISVLTAGLAAFVGFYFIFGPGF